MYLNREYKLPNVQICLQYQTKTHNTNMITTHENVLQIKQDNIRMFKKQNKT